MPLLGTRADASRRSDAKIALVNGKPHITPSISSVTPDPTGLAAKVPAALREPDPYPHGPGQDHRPGVHDRRRREARHQAGHRAKDPNGGATPHPCCRPRVHNISLIAGIVNNAIILPGQTFSLNAYVGQRTAARGFVLAPEISAGAEKQAVGGGVSQFATTMFNAAYFTGMKILEHHPHSFWISRYPPGREATVSWPEPDLKWQNNTPYGILVQAWDDGTHTHVRVLEHHVLAGRLELQPRDERHPAVTTYETPDELSGKQAASPTVAETGFDITIYRTLSLNGVAQPQESGSTATSRSRCTSASPTRPLSPGPGTRASRRARRALPRRAHRRQRPSRDTSATPKPPSPKHAVAEAAAQALSRSSGRRWRP